MNEIIQAISTVGFPIACCCFLLWQNSKQDQYNREQQEKLRLTIDNNTKSMEELREFTMKALQEMRNLVSGVVDMIRHRDKEEK